MRWPKSFRGGCGLVKCSVADHSAADALTREDWGLLGAVSLIIFVANANYVSGLYLLWHDDVTSYFHSINNHMMMRGGATVTRHLIVDNFLAQIMANVSPFVARLVLIATGGVPLFLLCYLALRCGFMLAPGAAALGAGLPLLLAGQWEIFVGINLSYVVFDAAFCFACILILSFARKADSWIATIIASLLIAISISDGMFSSALLAPAIFWAALFIRPRSLPKSALILVSVIATTIKVVREQASLGRAQWASDPWHAVVSNIAVPIDTVLPGGEFSALALLLVVGIAGLASVYLSIRYKAYWLVAVVGFAAALYIVPIVIYSVGRGGFPNRYSFIPVVGLACFAGVLFHFASAFVRSAVASRGELKLASGSLSLAAGVVLVGMLLLGFQKATHVEQHIDTVSRRTKLVSDYLHYGASGPVRAGVDIRPQDQLILVAENNFPYLYPHRGPGLGYLRFVTSNNNIVGYAGRRRQCADPFSPWESFWAHGPGGLTTERPIRIVGFFGPNGRGTEMDHMLSTQGEDLNAPWVLYEAGHLGARPLGHGSGREALEALLSEHGLEPHQIAFSCGL